MIKDGWFDFAEKHPGPVDKVYSQPNAAMGYVPHSAVGVYAGWLGRLYSTARDAAGRYTPYAAASVHGFILYNGHVIQHYAITASCWASGAPFPNTNFIAFENEGGFNPENEPLTDAQVDSNVRIIRELSQLKGWNPTRPTHPRDIGANLYEHTEMTRFGSAPTACPSGRIPWPRILAELEEDEVTQAEFDAYRLEVKRIFDAVVPTVFDQARRISVLEMKVKALEA